jgi:hypothetical protein
MTEKIFIANKTDYRVTSLCFMLRHKKAQETQERFKLNGTHQLLFYADDANLLEEKLSTVP